MPVRRASLTGLIYRLGSDPDRRKKAVESHGIEKLALPPCRRGIGFGVPAPLRILPFLVDPGERPAFFGQAHLIRDGKAKHERPGEAHEFMKRCEVPRRA